MKYVITVSPHTKSNKKADHGAIDIIMMVCSLYNPMFVGFLLKRSCFNIMSDSDGLDRKQIFRIKKEDYYGTFIRFQDQGHHEIT